MSKKTVDDRTRAYTAGWRASARPSADLDAAERRFCNRFPDPDCMFSAGWVDYAVGDRPFGYTLRKEGTK